MKFRVKDLTVLCIFQPVVGQHLLLLEGNIDEFYTSKYRAIFSCSYPTACIVCFCIVLFFGFSCQFSVSSVVCSYYSFSISYMFYLHFWGTLFSKQRSVNVSKRDVGSVSSTYCSNILFVKFEQVTACWGSITLDYLGFLLFFE